MKLTIELGALCPPPSEQLAGKLPAETLARIDVAADAISLLHLRGILTGAESDKARRRLIRRIGAKPVKVAS